MGDQAYIVGGTPYGAPATTATRVYDLSDNAWTDKTACTYRRCGETSGAGAAEDGYTFGNDEVANSKKTEKYSIANNSWTTKTDQPYVEGGGSRPSPVGGKLYLNSLAYIYSSDAWRAYIHGLFGHGGAIFGIGGYFYGGQGGDSFNGWVHARDEEKFDPSSESWTQIADMPGRHGTGGGATGASDGTYGIICGGYSHSCAPYQSNEVDGYDPSNDTWTAKTTMGVTAYLQGSFTINGMAHILGGFQTPDSRFNWNGRFNYVENSWISEAAYPESKMGMCGFFVPANLPPNAPTNLSVSGT